MVLDSQAPRYMRAPMASSRRRRRRGGGRLKWIVLLLLVGTTIFFIFPGGDEEPSDQPAPVAVDDTPAEERSLAELYRSGDVQIKPASPNVVRPTITRPVSPSAPVRPPLRTQVPSITLGNTATPPKVTTTAAAPKKPNPAPALSRIGTAGTPGDLINRMRDGIRLLTSGRRVEARAYLSNLLINADALSREDAEQVRNILIEVNKELIFSTDIEAGDPVVARHLVQSGQSYVTIARKYNVTPKFLELINKISPRRLPAGKNIKVIKGPFHAVIHKSTFRMDLYLPGPGKSWVFAQSFPVGLGENDSTPVGGWIVKAGSKVTNPAWKSPRDSRYFQRDDPKNPIGEHWLGLEGTDENTKTKQAYGIHGTVDPDSIGQQRSMGCIRMRAADVEMVYHMLIEKKSTVIVRP